MSMISFVIPCYYSANTIEAVVEEIVTTIKETDKYEIILVNDGSTDNTYPVLKKIADINSHVTAINMSRNFGQHSAIMAGLNNVSSDTDYVVCLDDDGQTPADEVYKLIDKIEEGYDVVYASYPHKQHSVFRNMGTYANEKMTEVMLGKPKEIFITSYFIVRKYIVDEIIKYQNPYPYIEGLILRSTDNIACTPVNHRKREIGQSGYTLRKLFSMWIDGFTAFSVKPLRIASFLGACSAVIGFIYAIYTFVKSFVDTSYTPAGWPSLMIILLIMGGLILLVLGLIGEYIGRMYISMNSSPQYVIKSIYKNNEDK